eukprot:590273-Prymnesium_polylepis.1
MKTISCTMRRIASMVAAWTDEPERQQVVRGRRRAARRQPLSAHALPTRLRSAQKQRNWPRPRALCVLVPSVWPMADVVAKGGV